MIWRGPLEFFSIFGKLSRPPSKRTADYAWEQKYEPLGRTTDKSWDVYVAQSWKLTDWERKWVIRAAMNLWWATLQPFKASKGTCSKGEIKVIIIIIIIIQRDHLNNIWDRWLKWRWSVQANKRKYWHRCSCFCEQTYAQDIDSQSLILGFHHSAVTKSQRTFDFFKSTFWSLCSCIITAPGPQLIWTRYGQKKPFQADPLVF